MAIKCRKYNCLAEKLLKSDGKRVWRLEKKIDIHIHKCPVCQGDFRQLTQNLVETVRNANILTELLTEWQAGIEIQQSREGWVELPERIPPIPVERAPFHRKIINLIKKYKNYGNYRRFVLGFSGAVVLLLCGFLFLRYGEKERGIKPASQEQVAIATRGVGKGSKGSDSLGGRVAARGIQPRGGSLVDKEVDKEKEAESIPAPREEVPREQVAIVPKDSKDSESLKGSDNLGGEAVIRGIQQQIDTFVGFEELAFEYRLLGDKGTWDRDVVRLPLPSNTTVTLSNTTVTLASKKDRFRLVGRPTQDCWLYIFWLDPLPQMLRLFPNSQFNSLMNPIEGGRSIFIPADNRWFWLDENIGKEQILIVVSKERRKDWETLYEQYERSKGGSEQSQSQQALDVLVTSLRSVIANPPTQELSGYVFEFNHIK